MINKKVIKNEFSRIIDLENAILEKTIHISANENELKNLANRFEVSSIKNIDIEYILTDKIDVPNSFLLSVSFKSKVVKFILEGKEENINIDENFDLVLIDEETLKENKENLKEYDIEIIDNDNKKVDIAEITSQYISLCVFM